MTHIILPWIGWILAGIYIAMLRDEVRRLKEGSYKNRSMTVSDFDHVYQWIRSGMPEKVAKETPPGFALDAMRLVWFAVKGEKR